MGTLGLDSLLACFDNFMLTSSFMHPKIEHYLTTKSKYVNCLLPAEGQFDPDRQIQDGWPKLREFLEIEGDTNDTFPHENKGGDVDTFVSTLWDKSKYQEGYEQDLKEYLEKYGITMLTNKE